MCGLGMIVRTRQGLWCDCGQHLLHQGDFYTYAQDGRTCCSAHVPDGEDIPPVGADA